MAYLDCVQAGLASTTAEELRLRTLLPSVLRPQGGAFKGEL